MKNNIKRWIHKQSMTKLLVLSVLFMFMFAGTSYAIWIFFINDSLVVTVTSEGQPLSFSVSFADVSIDTSNSSMTKNSTATLSNSDGAFNMNISATEIRTATDVDCQDYENDCIITYFFEGNEINSSAIVPITAGNQDIKTSVFCVQNSCPQNISIEMNLTSVV